MHSRNPPKTISEYIDLFPESVQERLTKIRDTIRDAAPNATEAIKYGIPTFILNGNLVHFGAYANHVGFYPGVSGIETFRKELGEYQTSKGTVQFPHNIPIPYALLKKIVEQRVRENML